MTDEEYAKFMEEHIDLVSMTKVIQTDAKPETYIADYLSKRDAILRADFECDIGDTVKVVEFNNTFYVIN